MCRPDRTIGAALTLAFLPLFGIAALSRRAVANPLDTSREACVQHLPKPGTQPDLVAMICDSQTYLNPAQQAAKVKQLLNAQEASRSHDAAIDMEYRQWLLTHPGVTRQEWEMQRIDGQQMRIKTQAAVQRAREHAAEQQDRRDRIAQENDARAQRQLDSRCLLQRNQRSPLFVNGNRDLEKGRYSDVGLPPECWGRDLERIKGL